MSEELQSAHALEVRTGKRFEFGSNWRRFLHGLDERRIHEAEKSLKEFLETDSLWTECTKSRGMSRWHDMIDWIGGYPYEYAAADHLVAFYEKDGFKLRKLAPNDGYGCRQLVFEHVS